MSKSNLSTGVILLENVQQWLVNMDLLSKPNHENADVPSSCMLDHTDAPTCHVSGEQQIDSPGWVVDQKQSQTRAARPPANVPCDQSTPGVSSDQFQLYVRPIRLKRP